MNFNDRLRMLRKEKGYTQSVVADALKYGYTAISNYESGKNQPSIDDLIRLSKLFDVTVDYLVGASDIRSREYEKEEILWNLGDLIKIKNGEKVLKVEDILMIHSIKNGKYTIQYVLEDEMVISLPGTHS